MSAIALGSGRDDDDYLFGDGGTRTIRAARRMIWLLSGLIAIALAWAC